MGYDPTVCDRFQDKELQGRLDKVVNRPFARVTYEKAVEMLQAAICPRGRTLALTLTQPERSP